jgi:hypothetical protein
MDCFFCFTKSSERSKPNLSGKGAALMKRYLFFSFSFIIAATQVSFENQRVLVPILFGAVMLIDRQAIRTILQVKFLLFLSILVFVIPALIGEKDAYLFQIPYSSQIFRMSVEMAHRSIFILLAIKIMTRKISTEQLTAAFQKIHLNQFSEVFSIAMRMTPEIRKIFQSTFRDFHRSKGEGNIISKFYKFAIKLFVNILLFAEEYHQKINEVKP